MMRLNECRVYLIIVFRSPRNVNMLNFNSMVNHIAQTKNYSEQNLYFMIH